MTIYVDDPKHHYGRMIMCHMFADSTEELLQAADAIGVDRKYIQKQGTIHEHFDICKSNRSKAIALGAKEIDRRQVFELISRRRRLGK